MVLLTTWYKLEQNATSYISTTIAKGYLEPLPASANLTTSMSDETLIKSLLDKAGFSKISIEKVEKLSVSLAAKEAAYGLVKGGPYYKEIKKRNLAWINEIKSKAGNNINYLKKFT